MDGPAHSREDGMGIYDRGYYQEQGGRRPGAAPGAWTVVTWLIVINIVVFFLQVFFTPKGGKDLLQAYGHFSTYRVLWEGGLEFWRFLSFQFLHGSVMHIAFNMFGLYMFGPIVEAQLGAKKFLAFYLVCGIFGAVMYLLLNLAGVIAYQNGIGMIPGLLFNSTKTPLVGASAGIFGVIMACAYIRPDEKFMLMLPPVAVKVKWLAYGYFGIALINLLFGKDNQGGEAAHVGGAIAGFFFVRNSHLLRDFFDVFDDSRAPKGKKVKPNKMPKHLKLVRPEDEKFEAEMDRILAKIQASGRDSLSAAELKFMEDATKRKRES